MRLLDQYNLSQNQPLRTAVAGACMKASFDIRGEDPQTPNHANRLIWAARSPMFNAEQMMTVVDLDGFLQMTWEERTAQNLPEPDRFIDQNVTDVVNGYIDNFATGN